MNLSDIIAVLQGLHSRLGNRCRVVFKTPDDNRWTVDGIEVDYSYPQPHVLLTQNPDEETVGQPNKGLEPKV